MKERLARTRFAPSPTGIPHIGNLHTALFSWALARANRGDFVIRIEDTDPTRNTPAAAQRMLAALEWLGLDWDEGPDCGGEFGPYVQSQRIERHHQVADDLVARGAAYYGETPGIPVGARGNAPLRLRLPPDGHSTFVDALRGSVSIPNRAYADPVIMRSDGTPLYHLAATADDHDMQISHVVRGEEWLSSTPLHNHIYDALEWTRPVWIHLPLILNQQGEKLKKRDPEGGYLIDDFQQRGYLPQALFNYLLLLGWSPDGEAEIVDRWEVRQQFRVERLSRSPSIFDWSKLNWVNRHYMSRLSDSDLAALLSPYLDEAYGSFAQRAPAGSWLVSVTRVVREELDRLSDVVTAAEWAFERPEAYTAAAADVLQAEMTPRVLTRLIAMVAGMVLLDSASAGGILQNLRRSLRQAHGLSTAQVFRPIRAALTGRLAGPPLADMMGVLGKEETLQRLAHGLQYANQ